MRRAATGRPEAALNEYRKFSHLVVAEVLWGAARGTSLVGPQIVEGLVLREVRAAPVFVDDPLNGGTEHWEDRLSPPSLDLLLSSQAGERRDSEWSRMVWRLESGPGEKFRALQRVAQRVEVTSDATVSERIQRIEGATTSWEYAVASAIDDSCEMAGRALVRLADEVATEPGSEAETLAEQVGRHSAIVKGL